MLHLINKKNMGALFLMGMLALGAASCKQIPQDQRLIEVEDAYYRTVLLEDYTGKDCVNCPNAAKAVADIVSQLKGKCIPVSIHGHEDFTPTTNDLYSQDGAEYCRELGVFERGSLPAGVFSRRELVGADGPLFSFVYASWMKYVSDIAKLPQLYTIELLAETSASNAIQVSCKVLPTAEQTETPNLKLQLWLLEDNIIAPQKSREGTINDYQHMHVLREALNGTWGTDYTLGTVVEETYTIKKEAVQMANTRVVAFVYDAETREVYEAAEVAVKNN